jgi:hypothetical protein
MRMAAISVLRRWHQFDSLARVGDDGLAIWINRSVGYVNERNVRRMFRSAQGDWCAQIAVRGKVQVEVFDHHPRAETMRWLQHSGTEVADWLVDQGAEGEDMRSHARRADDR